MQKGLVSSLAAGSLILFLTTACAEDSKDSGTASPAGTPALAGQAEQTADQSESVMDQPVNFSTPKEVEKTFQRIEEQEGGRAAGELKSALQYLQLYDLSVGNNREKLYKKLDGKTPRQIMDSISN